MSREKQIEEMARDICHVKQSCNDVCHPINSCRALKYAERFYNAGYRKQEWISVDERLPKVSGAYLTCSYLGNRNVLAYSARHKLFNSFDIYSAEEAEVFAIGVTHWMPLPETPKMKGGAE